MRLGAEHQSSRPCFVLYIAKSGKSQSPQHQFQAGSSVDRRFGVNICSGVDNACQARNHLEENGVTSLHYICCCNSTGCNDPQNAAMNPLHHYKSHLRRNNVTMCGIHFADDRVSECSERVNTGECVGVLNTSSRAVNYGCATGECNATANGACFESNHGQLVVCCCTGDECNTNSTSMNILRRYEHLHPTRQIPAITQPMPTATVLSANKVDPSALNDTAYLESDSGQANINGSSTVAPATCVPPTIPLWAGIGLISLLLAISCVANIVLFYAVRKAMARKADNKADDAVPSGRWQTGPDVVDPLMSPHSGQHGDGVNSPVIDPFNVSRVASPSASCLPATPNSGERTPTAVFTERKPPAAIDSEGSTVKAVFEDKKPVVAVAEDDTAKEGTGRPQTSSSSGDKTPTAIFTERRPPAASVSEGGTVNAVSEGKKPVAVTKDGTAKERTGTTQTSSN